MAGCPPTNAKEDFWREQRALHEPRVCVRSNRRN
jgi:hypothetical protein